MAWSVCVWCMRAPPPPPKKKEPQDKRTPESQSPENKGSRSGQEVLAGQQGKKPKRQR